MPEVQESDAKSCATRQKDAGEQGSSRASKSPFTRRRARLRRWSARVAMLGLSILLALAVGEMAVRLTKPQVLLPRYVTDGGFGIRVNVPNVRYWHTTPEVQVQFRINSMGIRADREYQLKKPPGTIRIVGLGDSFTQGYEVDVTDTYLCRLEGMLSARGIAVEVINLGVSGHSNAEELLMLREFGFRFHPDVVIVSYFVNDLDDNVRTGLYRLDGRDQLVRAAGEFLPAVGIRDKLYSIWVYRWLAENSQLFAFCRERLSKIVKRRLVEKSLDGVESGIADDYPARLAAHLLDEIKHECAQRNVGFLLLDIPASGSLESNLPVHKLQSITSEETVRTGPMLQAEGPDAYLYRRRGHSHWTPRAHEIAAELLADALIPVLQKRRGASRTLDLDP